MASPAMQTFRTLSFLAVLLTLLASTGALAQPVPLAPAATPSADDAKEAKRHFTVGNDLYRDGRFQDAVVEFDVSYRLGGADCRRQLNEYADAYDAYRVLLDRHRSQLSAADQAAVQKAIDELDALTGLLSVTAKEEGAEIVVDDSVLAPTPLATKLRLSVGRHKLVVRKAGFVSFELAGLELISKQTVTVDAKLVPEVVTGHLSVRETNGREVHVFVDDADKGPAPWEGDLAPGPHAVEAKGERFAAEKRPVQLGKRERLDVVLTAEPTTGRLRIPADAAIEVDHRQVGTGIWEGEVAPGPHHIEVALAGTHTARDVVVERGATVVQEIPLAMNVETPPEYEGIYARFDIMGALGQGHEYFVDNSSDGRQKKPTFGGGAMLELGYNFGVVSAGLVGGFLLAKTSEGQLNLPMNVDRFDLSSFDAFVGPAARVTTRSPSVRFTASVAFGAAIRTFNLQAALDQGGNTFTKTAGYVDPGLLMGLGLSFGGTPGAKFVFGLVTWLDFPGKDVVVGPDTTPALTDPRIFTSPGRGYVLASGPQFFLGLTLGVQIGH